MKMNSITRKLFTLCLTAVMLVSLAMPAFADDAVVCTGVEGCAAEIHNEGCPAIAPVVVPCTGAEGCPAESHNEGCPAIAPVVVPCTGAEGCPAESHNEGCPAITPVVVPCTGAEGCPAESHNEGCPAIAPVVVPCTGAEGCTAESHNEGCPAVAPVVVPCTGVEGCAAETHNEGCPAVAPVVVPCTGAEGCTAESHSEGCPAAAPIVIGCTGTVDCGAESHNEGCLKAETDLIAGVQAMIDALKTEVKQSELDAAWEEYEKATAAIAALSDAQRGMLDLTNYYAAAMPTVIPDNTETVSTYDDLVAALANDTITDITLTASITAPDAATLNIVGKNVDLGGNTLTINGESGRLESSTLTNGNVVITTYTGDTIADGIFDIFAPCTISNVNFSSNGCAIYSLFDMKSGEMSLTNCRIEINNNQVGDGGIIFFNGGSKITMTGCVVDCTNPGDFITNGAADITGCSITLKGTVPGGLDNGINGTALNVSGSTISIDGATGRGITTDGDNLSFTNGSTVTITNCGEGGIRFRASANITVDDTSTLAKTSCNVDAAATAAAINGVSVPVNTGGVYTNVSVIDTITTVGDFTPVAYMNNIAYPSVQAALDAANKAPGSYTITLAPVAISENAVVWQSEGVNISIVGSTGTTFNGTIRISGEARYNGAETVSISGVNFVGPINNGDSFIYSDKNSAGTYSYAHNVTISGCGFSGDGLVAVRISAGGGAGPNWKIENCTVYSGMHSLLQATGATSIAISGNTISAKNGINLNTSSDVSITGNIFDVKGYAVRSGESTSEPTVGSETITIASNTIISSCDDAGDAPIMLRKSANDAVLNMSENSIIVPDGKAHIFVEGNPSTNNITADKNFWSGTKVPTVSGAKVKVKNVYSEKERINLVDLAAELPTATVTDIPVSERPADTPLTMALKFKADEASEAQLYYYGDWYADFVLTINKPVTFNADGTVDGYLAGQYDDWSVNWVSVPFSDVTLAANESLKIMEYAASLMGQPGLKVTYNDVYYGVKEFDCGVFFSDTFLAANKDLQVSLELRVYDPWKADPNSAGYDQNYTGEIIGKANAFSNPMFPILVTAPDNSSAYYETLSEAINAAPDGSTIEILDDVTISAPISITSPLTINGNGNTITYTGKDRAIDVPASAGNVAVSLGNFVLALPNNPERGINFNTNGSLEVSGVVISGTPIYGVNLPGSSDNANVEISASEIHGLIPLNIWGSNATVNVADTSMTSHDDDPNFKYAVIQLNNNGTDIADGTVVNVVGGILTALENGNPTGNVVSNWSNTGVVNISSSTSVNGNNTDVVARIGAAGYQSVQAAINSANDSDVIILTKDSSTDTALSISKNTTINAMGKKITFTGTGNGIVLENNAVLSIAAPSSVADIRTLAGTLCVRTNADGSVSIHANHEGGTANCKDLAVCNQCGQSYGSVNDNAHVLTYTGSGNVITEGCSNGCGHSATATLVIDPAIPLVYSGKPVTPLKVEYSDEWKGLKDVSINYQNNIKAGNASGSATKGGATATQDFVISDAVYMMVVNNNRYVRGSGLALSFTTNVPATEGILSVVLTRANGSASMNIPLNLIGLSVNGYGQIVVTLPPAIMNPLDSSNYVLTVQFENGIAQAPFRVLLPSVFPMTGDEAPTVILLCTMFVSLTIAGTTLLIIRKNRKRANGRHSR